METLAAMCMWTYEELTSSLRAFVDGGAIVTAAAVTRPESRGSVRLTGRDPHDVPVIMGGPGDERAVVDESPAVKGPAGLRAVDASIMPVVPSTVTDATTVMIAEHIARRVYGS